MTERTSIILTDRAPVSIEASAWPVYASASAETPESDPGTWWNGEVCVRRHADGRAIVSAVFSYYHESLGPDIHTNTKGELIAPDCTGANMIAAIKRVHASIDHGSVPYLGLWRLLADKCIANLPPEELS